MARNTRQQIDAGGGVDVQIQVFGPQAQRAGRRQRKGRLAQLKGVNAEQQVVHHRVADKDRIDDQVRRDIPFGRDLGK